MGKRFYKSVIVENKGDGFTVLLDGRLLKTPGKMPLVFKTAKAAELVAEEWRAQGADILPNTMPCTRLMNVACEQTPPRRGELVKEFCTYTETDLLCYRSHHPQDLSARQQENWQPVLDWAGQQHGIVLATTTGIKSVAQPEQSLQHARKFAENLENPDLTLLLHFTASYGSAVLALAVMEKHLTADTAFSLSRLDELFQNERWGEDDEVVQKNADLLQELRVMAQLIKA